MAGNQHWYHQQSIDYSQPDEQHDAPLARVAADSVHDAHGLLAVYPMASATPASHVARHLGNMTITATPPSFIQPNYYNLQGLSYPQGNPPPYTEYANEINYLAARQMPGNDAVYWENTRNDAVRLVGEQAGPSYPYPSHSHWSQSPVQSSTYGSPSFAQAVFQRTAPTVSYPTPPPPGITTSSSSLAFALGPPVSQPTQRTVDQPEQSARFFNNFLSQKAREINTAGCNVTTSNRPATPPHRVEHALQESPDPLALKPNVPSISSTMITPRKRKPVVQIESPSVKRIQPMQSATSLQSATSVIPRPSTTLATPRSSTTPINPSTSSTSKHTPKRTMTMAYVQVPPKPWLTPSSSKRDLLSVSLLSKKSQGKMNVDDTPDDLGGYGSEEDYTYSPSRIRSASDVVKSSARRTGDRDERAPLEKLSALFDDIFEAEDALPLDMDIVDLPSEFFSPLTIDCARPLLHPNIIRKLTKYICQVAWPTKRVRQGATGNLGSPRGKGRMAEVDTQVLSRILKMLDRNVKAGEDLDPFIHVTVAAATRDKMNSPRKPITKKAGKGSKKNDARAKSRTPQGEEDGDQEADNNMAMDTQVSSKELIEMDYEKLTRALEIARDSILAADCCIALLGSDRLTKQLYSEELITACLGTIKNQLTRVIYPFVEASTETNSSTSNPILHHIVKNASHTSQTHRRQLSETFQALSAVLPRINNLVNAESVAMSDSIIIQAVYIAIGPFFVVESGGEGDTKVKKENVVLRTFGKSAMRGLRLDALSLIRSIFANHEDQRSWIIEEILTSLIKLSDTKQKAGQFRLRDGRSIRTVSALLLQLVQTSAHDVRIDAKKIEKARQQKFALRRHESFSESQQAPEPFLDENDLEEIRLYTSGLESATKAAKTIILFLMQRSGKGKATKNSNEAEYRTILDNLISDLLAVLYWPEWPAASLLLSIACKFMVSSLDDVKTSSQTENNAAKTIALEHLGVIAARIRSSMLKIQQSPCEAGPNFKSLKALDEIVSSVDTRDLGKLLAVHKDVASHLCKRSSEDQAYDSARELTAVTVGRELAAALKQVNVWILDPEEEDLSIKDDQKLLTFGQKIKSALRDVWKDHATDVFDIGSQEEVVRIDRLAEEIGTIQGLRSSFHPILNVILLALDAPPIFMRTKALRALGQIVTSDATILSAPNVRRAIESHLLDSSPAVRDAAVELIGKYMIDSPEVAGDYYQKIADRIADTGLSVRKRVIKLLKSFYGVTEDNNRRIDIATRLVLRMMDEDDTVKDLTVKTIEELWFQNTTPLPSALKSRTSASLSNPHNKSVLLSKVAVIMGVSANFKDRHSPLEDMLHKIMADKQNETSSLHDRYAEICETLIDGLVDASDLPGFTVINCIRTIFLFTSAYPAILSGANASTLLPYLKNATSADEQGTSDYLLKIFRTSIPHMPKTAAKFGHELQLALQPMIIKPSTAGGILALQETVACMCTVVQNLTHDFVRLVALVKSCNGRLQQAIKRPVTQAMAANDIRALSILIFIVSLLGEHCDFDQLRLENSVLVSDLNAISEGSIIEHIYNSLLQLYEKYDNSGLRGRILQCLGFLFRAQPTLMTLERSAMIMDAIFASPEEDGRGRLLKIMQDFLISEASKHSAKEKENIKGKSKRSDVNMDELVGNTDGFADSGVSSAVVQRYLGPILEAALSQHLQIQAVAIDVLSFTIKQGLAHPLQSFPVIVALETSPIISLCNRASALHTILHSKHTSLLNTRYTVSARASFDYQRKISSGLVRGFRMQPTPTALLQRWYSLVREKRPARQDFLKALVKVFQGDPSYKSSQDDVDFTRYMAENFAAFDYKTQEEVFTVINYLTTVLSTTGTQLLDIISPSHLLTQLRGPSQPNPPTSLQEPATDGIDVVSQTNLEGMPKSNGQDNISVIRSSVIVGMVMLLKAHLKTLYSLSEDKCNKFVIGKKSAVGDKPTTKRHENPISWDRLPFATTPLLSINDVNVQSTRFLDIWNEDGLAAEPDEDFTS